MRPFYWYTGPGPCVDRGAVIPPRPDVAGHITKLALEMPPQLRSQASPLLILVGALPSLAWARASRRHLRGALLVVPVSTALVGSIVSTVTVISSLSSPCTSAPVAVCWNTAATLSSLLSW